MAAEHRYDPHAIEPKWQELWERERTWEVSNDEADSTREKSYVLEMLPYPSGEPHMGHLKNYAIGDAVAHFHRRTAGGCCTRWATTRSACRPRTTRSRPASTRATRPRTSIAAVPAPVPRVGDLDRLVARVRHARAALLPLDAVDLPAVCSSAGWPTGTRRRSTGARRTRRCWPTSRSSTGAASAAARRSRRASSSSGSSASPTTPTGCWTTSTRSAGPSTSRRCSATGSGARRAPRSRSRARRSASTTRCSRPGRTRCSARRSSSWRPSTPTSSSWPRAPSTSRRSTSTSTAR